MFQSIFNYWDVISTYTNPTKILVAAVSFSIISLIISIVVVILLRKKILIQRQHTVLRYVSYSYFFVIPLLTLFFGFKFGLIKGVHQDIDEHLHVYSKSFEASYGERVNKNIQSLLKTNNNVNLNISSNQAIDTVSDILYSNYSTMLDQVAKKSSSIDSEIAKLLLKLFREKGISVVIKKTIESNVESVFGIDKEVTHDVMQTKINELLTTGVFTKIISVQIDKFFNSIKTGIVITYSILLLIPFIEIIIAYWLNKKITIKPTNSSVNSN